MTRAAVRSPCGVPPLRGWLQLLRDLLSWNPLRRPSAKRALQYVTSLITDAAQLLPPHSRFVFVPSCHAPHRYPFFVDSPPVPAASAAGVGSSSAATSASTSASATATATAAGADVSAPTPGLAARGRARVTPSPPLHRRGAESEFETEDDRSGSDAGHRVSGTFADARMQGCCWVVVGLWLARS